MLPVFVNPAAGRGRMRMLRLGRSLADAGVRTELRPVPATSLRQAVAAAVARDEPIIAVAGGDGTISAAADAVAGSRTVLLPIPMGTLNHFARRFGIQTLSDAILALKQGRVSVAAVGRVDGHIFVNSVGGGYYPHLLRHRERWRRWLTKWPAHLAGAAAVMVDLPLLELELELEMGPDRAPVLSGSRVSGVTPAIWVGIGSGSFRLPSTAPALPNAAVFEVVVARERRRLSLVTTALRVVRDLARDRPPHAHIRIHHAASFRLRADRPIDLALDGELYRLDPPLRFTLLPAAMRVLCLTPA